MSKLLPGLGPHSFDGSMEGYATYDNKKSTEEQTSHIDIVGYTPYPWQRAVHNAMNGSRRSGKIFVCKSKRQLGKSMMCCNVLLWASFEHKSTSILVSPTLSQARKVYQDIVQAADERLIKKKNETLLEIHWINGSKILFKSQEQRDSLRGYTVTGVLILDEAAYLDDSLLELVLPWTTVWNAPTLIVSTPKMKSGFFYRYFIEGLNNPSGKIQSIDWNDFDTSVLLSDERVEEYRRIMPKGQFRSEILGEFVDDGTGVFSTTPESWMDIIPGDSTYKELHLGIDFANGDNGDYTCVSGFNERGEQVVLSYFKDLTPLQQIERIGQIIRTYQRKIRSVLAERNSMGLTFIDLLREKHPGVNIQEFVTSNTTKREIIDAMVAAIGQNEMRLQSDQEMKKEISCYQMEITKSGLITYNGYAANDDLVMATALAWKSRTYQAGNYCLSFL